jgi:hypothetical protein
MVDPAAMRRRSASVINSSFPALELRPRFTKLDSLPPLTTDGEALAKGRHSSFLSFDCQRSVRERGSSVKGERRRKLASAKAVAAVERLWWSSRLLAATPTAMGRGPHAPEHAG